MWGGIRYQIEEGVNGFLVSSLEEAAARIVQLIKDKALRERMGQKARETVRRRFLMTRYLEDYLDLFNAFDTVYRFSYSQYRKLKTGYHA
jgi:trehalose synthase